MIKLTNSFAQTKELKITKGKWHFCVVDTLVQPYVCNATQQTTYKFRSSGKYVEKGVDMILFGKTIHKIKGSWKLNGNQLEIRADEVKTVMFGPKVLELFIQDQNTFYSPQQDWKTVYWLFQRDE